MLVLCFYHIYLEYIDWHVIFFLVSNQNRFCILYVFIAYIFLVLYTCGILQNDFSTLNCGGGIHGEILDTLQSTELHANFRRQREYLLKYSKVFGVVLLCRNWNSDLINILTKDKRMKFKFWISVIEWIVRHLIFLEIKKTQVWKRQEELAR